MGALFALCWHLIITRQLTVYWSPELTNLSVFFGLVIIGVLLASNRPIAISYFKGVYWKIIVMMFAIVWLTRTVNAFKLSSIFNHFIRKFGGYSDINEQG